jgi:NAD+ synthase (glutamine-hydrolysing)
VLVLNIKLAFAQTNPVVGDFANNAREIRELMSKAHESGVELLVFGELALSGYPMGDFSYRADLVSQSQSALDEIVKHSSTLSGLTSVVGHIAFANSEKPRNQVSRAIAHNSASVIAEGSVIGRYDKQLLPNYDVFDDWRNFVPGTSELVFEISGHRVGVAICEDIWGSSEQSQRLASMGVDLLVVPNGSPFTRGKNLQRKKAAADFGAGMYIAYANLAGGQDELVFDGHSFVLDREGTLLFEAGSEAGIVEFVSGMIDQSSDDERLWQALVTGLRDYLRKTWQKRVILGLSGGIDSALSAALAVAAVGPENVLGVALPSRYSSYHSLADAEKLAKNLGIEYRIVPIDPAHAAFESMIELPGLAGENVQARIRAVVLMAISNAEGFLLLTTGNKSELAVGYSTIYGDSAGGFAPIKDLFKTDVWRMARYFNERSAKELIPSESIAKPPSAELRPGQLDQDSLPDYETLDAVLRLLVEEGKTIQDAVSYGFAPTLVHEVDALVQKAEWKRSQSAIGTKVSEVAFGRGRRVPLTTRFEKS